MFTKVILTTCLLSLAKAAYQGPLAGGQAASLYPAGLDPRTCPHFPICTNPAVSAIQNAQPHQTPAAYQTRLNYQAEKPVYEPRHTATPIVQPLKFTIPEYRFVPRAERIEQYSQPQRNAPSSYSAPQRLEQPEQYTGPQQFTPYQQYARPQQYSGKSRDEQYTPEQKRALDRGEYIGDGDYHGEGLAEALAPEYLGPWKQQYYVVVYNPSDFIKSLFLPGYIPLKPRNEIKELHRSDQQIYKPEVKNHKKEFDERIEQDKTVRVNKKPFISKSKHKHHKTEVQNHTKEFEEGIEEDKTALVNEKTFLNKSGINHYKIKVSNDTAETEEENDQTKTLLVDMKPLLNVTNHKHSKTEVKNHTVEFEEGIEQAKSLLVQMRPFLCNKNVSLELRTRMVKYYVSSTIFRNMENQTITQDDMKKLEAFEEWIYTKILNISWTERVDNIEIFNDMGKEVKKTVKSKEIHCQGQVYVRKGVEYCSVQFIMNDELQGKIRLAGKRKTSWTKNLKEMYGCTSVELHMEDEK